METDVEDINLDGMLRPHELPFDVPDFLAEAIDNYIEAMATDDPMFDMYLEILFQFSGCLVNRDRDWLLQYYANSGWLDGMEYDG